MYVIKRETCGQYWNKMLGVVNSISDAGIFTTVRTAKSEMLSTGCIEGWRIEPMNGEFVLVVWRHKEI